MQTDTINQFYNLLSEMTERDDYSEVKKKKFANLAMSLAKVKEQTEKKYADMQLVLKSAEQIGDKELCHFAYEMNYQLSEEMRILEWCQDCAERIARE